MHPILFHLGSTPVHTYGVMGAVGFLVAAFVVLRRSREMMLNRDHVVDVIFWGSLAALAGSRALFLFQNPEAAHGVASWFNIREGGLVFYGALLTGLPVVALVIRWRKLPLFPLMDIIATAAPLAHGLSRLGCLAAGCCWGGPTDLPWAVTYSDPLTDAPNGVGLHPVQAYEALGLFAIGGLCAWRYPRKAFQGEIMLIYLVAYSLLRVGTEALRGDERGWFLQGWLGQTLSTSQGASLVVLVVALAVFGWGARRAKALKAGRAEG